jgi:hypothetical protein
LEEEKRVFCGNWERVFYGRKIRAEEERVRRREFGLGIENNAQ